MLATLTLCVLSSLPQDVPDSVVFTVTGVIVDAELRALSDVRVAVFLGDDGDVAGALGSPLAVTDADGAYRVQVEAKPDTSCWLVFGGGRLATQMHSLWVSESSEAATIELGAFAMAPGLAAAGRVRDENGNPIAGVTVTVTDMLDSRSFLSGRSRLPVTCRTIGHSNEKGIFRLLGMVQSAGTLRASKPGYYDAVLEPVGIGAPLDVVLRPAPGVQGRVVDADGVGVDEASVYLDGDRVGATAADGSFGFLLRQRGKSNIRATKRIDGALLSASCSVTSPTQPVELRLQARAPAATQSIRIEARSPDGERLPDFVAYASWNPDNQLQYRPDALLLAGLQRKDGGWSAAAVDGVASPSGRRASSRDNVGLVYVLADGFGLGRMQVTEDALDGDPVVVTLPREAVIEGRVTDADTGEPLAGVEVIPTQRLSDSERGHYAGGFREVKSLSGAPTSVVTDADGRYELRRLSPGVTDVFVFLADRIEVKSVMLELKEGEARQGLDFMIPANVTLCAKFEGAVPVGARARLHWHRPNMTSSAWRTDYSGALAVAADGTVMFEGLHPKPYEVQLLVSAPPRGGYPMKLPTEIWNGVEPPDEPFTITGCVPRQIVGAVGGQVPWQRLAVAVMWQDRPNQFTSNYRIDGPIALLTPDRRFRALAPHRDFHLLLFDVVTGVALEWIERRVDAGDDEAAFSGAAVAFDLTMADGAADVAALEVEYVPDPEHWPSGVGGLMGRAMGRRARTGMKCEVRAGTELRLWLPARAGQVHVRRDRQLVLDIDASTTEAAAVPGTGSDLESGKD